MGARKRSRCYPASVGLIIDNSGSMLDKRAEVAAAALSFVLASHPDDEIFVVNFNEKDVDQLRSALLSGPTGLTALYDALAVRTHAPEYRNPGAEGARGVE